MAAPSEQSDPCRCATGRAADRHSDTRIGRRQVRDHGGVCSPSPWMPAGPTPCFWRRASGRAALRRARTPNRIDPVGRHGVSVNSRSSARAHPFAQQPRRKEPACPPIVQTRAARPVHNLSRGRSVALAFPWQTRSDGEELPSCAPRDSRFERAVSAWGMPLRSFRAAGGRPRLRRCACRAGRWRGFGGWALARRV
jgi:hypothetical protein